jgi:4-hydroxy-tetrahydrodipicolinate synthase
MASYRRAEARDWAREHLVGCANSIIPSFSGDLRRVSERGLRHDVRRSIELGFRGSLLVSEVNVTVEEYRRVAEWAVDEASGHHHLVHHAAFNTLEENIEAALLTQAAGVDYVLLSYPANFYPEREGEVFDYTKAFCDAVDLGVMLFAVPLWNFGRLHHADLSPSLLERMVGEIPNVIGVKAEGARLLGGFAEVWRRFRDEVVVTSPLEREVIPLLALGLDVRYSGTSNADYLGDAVPRMFELARSGKVDAAMELYWQVHPAREANAAAGRITQETGFINRMQWKFQGWLQGMNGGPLRQPTMKVSDRTMRALRRGLTDSGLPCETAPNHAFFEGRNPE